jgi:hypothetical protein
MQGSNSCASAQAVCYPTGLALLLMLLAGHALIEVVVPRPHCLVLTAKLLVAVELPPGLLSCGPQVDSNLSFMVPMDSMPALVGGTSLPSAVVLCVVSVWTVRAVDCISLQVLLSSTLSRFSFPRTCRYTVTNAVSNTRAYRAVHADTHTHGSS